MNKKLTTLFILITMLFTSGCTSGKFEIETLYEATTYKYLEKSELSTKLEKNKDDFVLVITSSSCGSCATFTPYANEVISNNHIIIYAIDTDTTGFKTNNELIPFEVTPTVVIIKDGKVKNKTDINQNSKIFASATNFLDYLKKYITINNPVNMPLTMEELDNKIATKDSFIIYFQRTTCGDCASFGKYYLNTFNKDNPKKYYYTLDLDPFRPTASKTQEPDLYNTQLEYYNSVKDKYGLSASGNAQFGYLTGVVPTFQYYYKGVLTAMAVIYNDEYDILDDKLTILSSYYEDAPFIGTTYQRRNSDVTAYEVYKEETTAFYATKLAELFAQLYR